MHLAEDRADARIVDLFAGRLELAEAARQHRLAVFCIDQSQPQCLQRPVFHGVDRATLHQRRADFHIFAIGNQKNLIELDGLTLEPLRPYLAQMARLNLNRGSLAGQIKAPTMGDG